MRGQKSILKQKRRGKIDYLKIKIRLIYTFKINCIEK